MRLEPSLNVTPEGSLADIPAAVEREGKIKCQKKDYWGPPQKQCIWKFLTLV